MKSHFKSHPPKPRSNRRKEVADLEPQLHHAIEEIAFALKGFPPEAQARLLKAACVLCQLDADITLPNQ
jgi:hypothetical protein